MQVTAPPASSLQVCLFRTREDQTMSAAATHGKILFQPTKYTKSSSGPVTLHACPLARK